MNREFKATMTSLIIFSALSTYLVHADPVTINNNYNNQAPTTAAPAPQSNCNNQSSQSYGTNTPPGTYTINHGDGSSERVYTTGDKKPYIVDNGCNNSSPVQPYVYVQPPFPGPGGAPGPVPTPGPNPGPMPRH